MDIAGVSFPGSAEKLSGHGPRTLSMGEVFQGPCGAGSVEEVTSGVPEPLCDCVTQHVLWEKQLKLEFYFLLTSTIFLLEGCSKTCVPVFSRTILYSTVVIFFFSVVWCFLLIIYSHR